MKDNLMDIKQVAEYLKMNKMTIYKLAREGKLPAFRITSEWRFKKELLDAWLLSQVKEKEGMSFKDIGTMLSAGKTVLVVDDEEVIRDFFARVLKEYSVRLASSGEEALKMIHEKKPDLVLLDIKMPGIDGIETLRCIKELDKNIAVIMLSAHATLQINMEAARLGAFTSIAKPFDLAEIKALIQNAIDKPAEK